MKSRFFLPVLIALIVQGCTTPATSPSVGNDTPATVPVTKSGHPPAAKPAPSKQPETEPKQKKFAKAPLGTPHGKKTEALTGELLYYLLSAEIAGQRGRLDVAVPFYLKAAELSRDPQIVERATRVAVYARDEKRALKAARLWVELQPEKSEAHQVCAALLVRTGEIDEALVHMEWVLDHNRQGGRNGYMLITSLLSKEKDKQSALKAMEKLVARRPDEPDARYAYANLAMLMGRYELAEREIEKALEQRPRWTEAHILRANILTRKGEKERVLTLIKEAVEDAPKDTMLRMYYARKLVDVKKFEQARQQFANVLEYKPDAYDAMFALGLLNLQLQQIDDAKEYFQRLIAAGVRVEESHYYLGHAEELSNRPRMAIQHYAEVRKGKNYVDAQIRIAVILAKQGEIDAARERLQNVSAPTLDMELRLYLAEGEILSTAGRLQEAEAVYSMALQQMPDNSQLLYARAMVYEKMDRLQESIADLERIVKNEPNNAEALNALGYTLVDQTHRIREGKRYIEKALKLKPGDAAILDSLGWAYYRLGEEEKALHYLKQAFEKMKDPEIAAHLGEVLWVRGDQERARQVWEDALKDTPSDKVLLNVIERFTE